MWFVILLLILAAAYLLSLRGRSGHPGLPELRRWRYAHRGLHAPGRPENSMAAFRAALEGGYGIELDIHLMKDGNLAVIHDASLKRTAGADVKIEDLTVAELEDYRLQGTEEKIPLFSQVLALFDGKAPLIVELKCENNNYAALCEAAMGLLDHYHGPYCVESFDPRCVLWLKKHRPRVIRGQLAENWFRTKHPMPAVLKFLLACLTGNFVTRPDFTAYKFADRKMFGIDICRKLWGVQGVSWTIKSQEDLNTAENEGWIPIFEGFIPE
jgi:glycerophosphoryl diester phosphodiesterase